MEEKNFWKCISILLRNYNAVNKKIFACKVGEICKVITGMSSIDPGNLASHCGVLHGLLDVPGLNFLNISEHDLYEVLNSGVYNGDGQGFIVSLKLLTKNKEASVEAVGLLDFLKTEYTCTLQVGKMDDFQISLVSGELVVTALTNRRHEAPEIRWTDSILKPRLSKWAATQQNDNVFTSLQLINIEIYNELYKNLKAKHAKNLFAIWKESTDPYKFVYEDLAIAAYLICLWEEHDCSPLAFADLGCGNGLLVYILNQEGYSGFGYDVRSRRIWTAYPKTTLLFEETVHPDIIELPIEVDWIIANHSDELSPWIPVIAARSSYDMKYFLLPCCPYEFSGAKFQRRNSKVSGYKDFLQYLETVSEICGFETKKDRLKIPSTKRVAYIGITRAYADLNHRAVCSTIQEFIDSEVDDNPIKIRKKKIPVKNCTKIESTILNDLVKKIFFFLLGPQRVDPAENGWNEGYGRTINDIAKHLSAEDLKNIKSECGGIKTLLRNKHEIFEMSYRDTVRIRVPTLRDPEKPRPVRVKKRACFFALNHPDGCPLLDDHCTFIHENEAGPSRRD